MSIETLLEAAKFLELQAQQQQKTREENEVQERRRHEREAEKQRQVLNSYTQPGQINHMTRTEKSGPEHRHITAPGPPPPPTMPFTVIPIPVVSSTPTALPTPPTTATSPSTAPHLTPPRKDVHSLADQQALHQHPLISSQVKTKPTALSQSNGTKPPQQLQTPPGSINTASQHALQPALPAARGSPTDDHLHLDGKKRPGVAGTREVHNKLEKNRRAHLRECFETLKKSVPNVDEMKTSNLSVLRSALRYIQTLKRKEKNYEHEMERLAREKIALQQRLVQLKDELTHRLDVMEIDRVLRQTVQPDDDQASTSTASEGEDNIDEDMEDESVCAPLSALPKVPVVLQPEFQPASALITQHIFIPHKPSTTLPPVPPAQLPPVITAAPITVPALSPTPAQVPTDSPTSVLPTQRPQVVLASQTPPPAHTHIVTTPSLQPTVIAHVGSASHASVIQTVNHIIQSGSKHMAHIAPSSSSSVQLGPGPRPISHITVHPMTHLPAVYSQPVSVTQPTVMSHTLSPSQMNGPSTPSTPATVVGKQGAVGAQVVTHHPQLLGQTILNPVTMVTMSSFPVSTLKLS